MAQNVKEVIEKAKKELVNLTGFSSPSAVGVKRKESGFLLTIEVIEKRSIPESMDVLGLYEVETDHQGNIKDYKRVERSRRGDTKAREESA